MVVADDGGSFDPDQSYRSARLAAAALRWHSAPFAVSDNDDPRKPDPPVDCRNSLVHGTERARAPLRPSRNQRFSPVVQFIRVMSLPARRLTPPSDLSRYPR